MSVTVVLGGNGNVMAVAVAVDVDVGDGDDDGCVMAVGFVVYTFLSSSLLFASNFFHR